MNYGICGVHLLHYCIHHDILCHSMQEILADPSIANYAFFDKSLNWLCHRIDKKTDDHGWCPCYWEYIDLIGREKKLGSAENQVEGYKAG
ncbi:MAG TPA: hypothetical protein VFI73_10585 [Candidatus Nitrosopolaris sp.]|nr:hypothetical protein [Candidatus Nitrosopolaris sp.]